MVNTIIIFSVLIVIIVLIVSVVTTNKAYQYKHTVDPIEGNQHLAGSEAEKKSSHTTPE